MISQSYIKSNLKRMNHKFNKADSNKEALFFAKMAIIELCGWIEEAMDDIVLGCSNRNLKEHKHRDFIQKEVIDRTYGFHYTKNFQKMLITLIGMIMYEKLEKSLDKIKFEKMKAELSSLTPTRNAEAHTHIKAMRRINAPSVTLRQFEAIYEGLLDIDSKIKLMDHLR